jgi:hypothetical protein
VVKTSGQGCGAAEVLDCLGLGCAREVRSITSHEVMEMIASLGDDSSPRTAGQPELGV